MDCNIRYLFVAVGVNVCSPLAYVTEMRFDFHFDWIICLLFKYWGQDNWLPISWRHFQIHILEWNYTRISIQISLKFVPNRLINNIPALV